MPVGRRHIRGTGRTASAVLMAAVGAAILSPAVAPSRSSVGPAPIACVRGLALNEDEPPVCPVQGQTVVVGRVSGVVFVTLPGRSRVRLTEPHTIPISSLIDARHGRYRLMADEHSVGLRYATADFYGGTAEVLQGSGPKDAAVDLRLAQGNFSGCAQTSARTAARRSHPAVRHLWGDGKGHFVISGHYASAVVRGTHWRVTDYCDGSNVTVRRGTVAVRDFATAQTVLVHAGHSYFAPATATFVFPTTCPSANVPLGSVATITGTFSPPQPQPSPQVDYTAPSGATVHHTLHPDTAGDFNDQVTVNETGIWNVNVHLANAQSGGTPASCSFNVT